MMNATLSIQPPRWVLALLVLGMLLVVADLSTKRAAIVPAKPQIAAGKPASYVASHDPRWQNFDLPCGCRVDYADGMSPPCSIRYKNGSVMLFDHLYRASNAPVRSAGGGAMQLGYDEQDRVTYARYDPESAVYYFNKDGSLKEIRHSISGGRANVIRPKYTIERGVRTRYPHKLPHPHVPAYSAIGHVLAGTWKAYEK